MRVPGLVLVLFLAACSDPEAVTQDPDAHASDSAPLPAPEDAPGGVTGMPEPGEPGPRGIALSERGDEADVEPLFELEDGTGPDGQALPSPDGTAVIIGGDGDAEAPGMVAADGTGFVDDVGYAPPPPAGADPAAAGTVVQSYYGAIDSGDHATAHGLWADGGRASGQSLEQFRDGFSRTSAISVEITGQPQASGGDRARVPVAVASTTDSGEVRRFAGTYTLSREGDGAGDWRIVAADLREVQH